LDINRKDINKLRFKSFTNQIFDKSAIGAKIFVLRHNGVYSINRPKQLRIYVGRNQVTFMNAVSPPLLEVSRFCDHVLQSEDQDFVDFYWADARDISMVYIVFEPNFVFIGKQPLISKVYYWKNTWPENRLQETGGSGESGWRAQDDWYNGAWKAADVDSKRYPGVPLAISFTFKPLAGKDYQPTFRRTVKLRIQFNSKLVSLAKIKEVKIYTTTPCMPTSFSLAADQDWIDQETFTASIWNGYFSIKDQPTTDAKVGCILEKPVPIFREPGLGATIVRRDANYRVDTG
jgi:hypothetical protein